MQHTARHDHARPRIRSLLLGPNAEAELSVQDVLDFIHFVMPMNPCGAGARWQ
jgi:hypothetical protein